MWNPHSTDKILFEKVCRGVGFFLLQILRTGHAGTLWGDSTRYYKLKRFFRNSNILFHTKRNNLQKTYSVKYELENNTSWACEERVYYIRICIFIFMFGLYPLKPHINKTESFDIVSFESVYLFILGFTDVPHISENNPVIKTSVTESFILKRD